MVNATYKAAFLMLFISFFALACSSNTKQNERDSENARHKKLRLLGTINSDSITVEQFEASYAEHLMATGENDTEDNRKRHWFNLVNQSLLAQLGDSLQLINDEYEQWKRSTHAMEAIEEYLRSELDKRFIEPTDSAARVAYIYKNTNVHLSHLFTYQRDEIEALYRRLENGEAFRDLANELYNTSSYDTLAGSMGEVSYFDLDYTFAKTAYNLSVGEYSKPVQSSKGYHIIYLDNFVRNPLLIEEKYQKKKQTITNLVRMGENTEMGEQFVAGIMQKHDIQVKKEEVQSLGRLMDQLSNRKHSPNAPSVPKKVPNSKDIEWISKQLNSATVLAHYTYEGEKKRFRASDYIKWLRYLPIGEAQQRIGISVGRALRNHILLRYASQNGFLHDEYVVDDMRRLSRQHLAKLVKDSLQNRPVEPGNFPIDKLKKAYSQSGLSGDQLTNASYWYIPVETIAEAKEIRQSIDVGSQQPMDFDKYVGHQNKTDGFEHDLKPYLTKARPHKIHILKTAKQLYLLHVDDVTIKEQTFETRKKEIIDRISPYIHTLNHLENGRKEASIYLDKNVFKSLLDIEQPLRLNASNM